MNVRKKFPAIFQYLPRFTSSLASQLTVIILLISFPTLVFTLFTLRQKSAMTREELVDGSFDSTVQIANQINSELKSYAAICLEGCVIVLACVIFSAFAASPPAIADDTLAAATIVWNYVGELIFNMLVLVGAIKMSDRIIRELMGLG